MEHHELGKNCSNEKMFVCLLLKVNGKIRIETEPHHIYDDDDGDGDDDDDDNTCTHFGVEKIANADFFSVRVNEKIIRTCAKNKK